MFIRWFFKHIVVILVICAALLGYLKFDDLAHWFPSLVAREEQSAKVGTAGEHVVAVSSGVAEDQNVPEAISQRHIGQSDSNSKPVGASDSREGGVSSQTEVESVFQRATETEETLAEPDIGSATEADSRDEVVADFTPASDEASKQAHKTQSAPSTRADNSSAVIQTQTIQVGGSEDTDEIGDVTRREAEASRRQQLPPTDTAADSKSLPTPLVEWIPPSAEPKEDTEEAAGTPAAQRQTVQEIWVDARTAFWNRDLAVAELKYHTLSAKLPDNPDVMGELGNVFYVQGKHKQTVAAYYRAAELLIDKGRSNRVNIILDLIYKLEPEKANTLRAKMARMHDKTGG